MNHVEKIAAHLQQSQNKMVDFLQKLACSESPSTEPQSQQEVFQILTEKLEGIGFRVEILPSKTTGGNLLAVPKDFAEGQPYQMLIGHCDTVWPIDTIKEMPVEVKDNILYGPGTYDMKGGLTQMLFALETLRDLQLDLDVAPMVFINSDEEIGSEESTELIANYAKNADRVFVLEPSLGAEGKLKTSRKGVGHFRVKVKGKAAHAGLDPQAGVSAIVELSMIVQKLFAMNDYERGISVNVGMIEGGVRPNVIAPESSAVIDVRVPTPEDAKMVEEEILNLQPSREDVIVEVEGRIGRAPMEQTKRNQVLWMRAQQAAQVLGIEIEQGCAGGGSDGNTTSLYTATLDGLGCVGDGAHATHEHIRIDKLWERTALLSLLLLDAPTNKN
ncbi:M20 family metallopeptidase [Candidatus Uabimicrobium amorphum]|uniref:Carboxypeptidase n=1 Tax=Uabimicrobium amorphum TaxID=2596890 RepID=A0A5S9IMF8_UABAM|nr:M20 family metallopeptidase [Candidatus Uabimicrobium amorphum]BBM84231.1 carboxypeptidase [Candidatus Uabimicrobium amorphum]